MRVFFICVVTTVVALVVVYCFLPRMEITSASFASYEHARPGIDAGWLPDWLPKSAHNVRESHDIDSNFTWLMFQFSASDPFFDSACDPINREDLRFPEDRYARRFPAFVQQLRRDVMENSELHLYRCDDSAWDRYLAIDQKSSAAYSWGWPLRLPRKTKIRSSKEVH